MAPKATPHATTRGLNVQLDVSNAPLVALPVVAVTLVEAGPIVAVGGCPFTPFILSAAAESVANPTEGGLYLNTENTFFCVHRISQTEMRTRQPAREKLPTRNVSPMIQLGALPVVPLKTKNAPTHWLGPILVS